MIDNGDAKDVSEDVLVRADDAFLAEVVLVGVHVHADDGVVFYADEEFLIVGFAGGGVAKDGRQASFDDGFEPVEDALCACVGGAEESVDSVVYACAGLV